MTLLDFLAYANPIASIFASLMVIFTIILTIRGLMEAIRSRSLNALQLVF